MKKILYLTLTSIILNTVACEKSEDVGTEIISNYALNYVLNFRMKDTLKQLLIQSINNSVILKEWKKLFDSCFRLNRFL